MIQFQLLGSIGLRDEGGVELRAVLAQPKRLALLAYLAAASPPGPQRRDTLLGVFWPELDQEHARNALSKAVHFLRRSVGEAAITSRSSEELTLDTSRVWTDVAAFQAALEDVRLEAALELYRGDLLPSFYVPDAPGFEDWLERERARLRSQAAKAARDLAERHEAGRHLTLAVASARRAVELSNGDERPLRRLIELLDRLGDRAGALRAFEEFAKRLAAELEVEPAAETLALVQRIRGAPRTGALLPMEPAPPSTNSEPTITRLARAVAQRYKIERQLGAGAMAVVALAHDLRHHRRVAIKVLRPELSSLMGPERFLREIDIAASLMHPHILPLHDSGEADGLLYYVMPYVEGESLRGRLERERGLAVTDVLQIGLEVADALAYAHHRGFIHRDIKPENILLGGGHALVADFGIARAIDSAGGEQLTTTGLGTGTPAYMSPEQITGESPVDERTDIYALGCVLYEMLTGEPPFSGSTPEQTMTQRLNGAAPRPSLVRKEVSPQLDSAVEKALARRPSDRFAKVTDLAAALATSTTATLAAKPGWQKKGRLVWAVPAVAIAAVVVLLLYYGIGLDARSSAGTDAVSSVAVLPIDNLSGDSSKAYLADGLTTDLIDELSRVEGLRLPGSATVVRYRNRRTDLAQVARELGVDAVVTGNLRELAGRPRVALQLVNARDGFLRWSGIYDQSDPTAGVDIATVLAESLRVQLRPQSRMLARSGGTRDAAAYRLYLKGRQLVTQVRKASIRQAREAFEQAIGRDSGFADAWAALPGTYMLLLQLGRLSPVENQILQRRAVERALALDSLNGEAYAARAHMRLRFEWDFAGADRDYRRAIELSPASAVNQMMYAQFLAVLGMSDSSLAVMRRALALDPESSWIIANHAFTLLNQGRAEEALAESERALQYDSTQWVAYHLRAWSYNALGQVDRTLQDLQRALQVFGDSVPFLLGPIGVVHARQGHLREARTVLAALERQEHPEGVWIARLRFALGDHEGALGALERAARDRELFVVDVCASGEFNALKGNPRYDSILEQVGLARFRRALASRTS
jgi:eukaryotic-like serine/threonine-protein kinase